MINISAEVDKLLQLSNYHHYLPALNSQLQSLSSQHKKNLFILYHHICDETYILKYNLITTFSTYILKYKLIDIYFFRF